MTLFDLLNSIWEAFKPYGIPGALAFAALCFFGFSLWRNRKKKTKWQAVVKAKETMIAKKEAIIEEKNQEIAKCKDDLADKITEMSNQRIADLKEVSKDYAELCSQTERTLDKLTAALKHEFGT